MACQAVAVGVCKDEPVNSDLMVLGSNRKVHSGVGAFLVEHLGGNTAHQERCAPRRSGRRPSLTGAASVGRQMPSRNEGTGLWGQTKEHASVFVRITQQ